MYLVAPTLGFFDFAIGMGLTPAQAKLLDVNRSHIVGKKNRYEAYNFIRFGKSLKRGDAEITRLMKAGSYSPSFNEYRAAVIADLKKQNGGKRVSARAINAACYAGWKAIWLSVNPASAPKPKDDKEVNPDGGKGKDSEGKGEGEGAGDGDGDGAGKSYLPWVVGGAALLVVGYLLTQKKG